MDAPLPERLLMLLTADERTHLDEVEKLRTISERLAGRSARHRRHRPPKITAFENEVIGRLGLLPNFFRPAKAAPGLIEQLWLFARSAYLDNPLPSVFKERLFVHLSRFCEVRYCVARHVGFLIGHGHAAGDALAVPHSVEQAVRLLSKPVAERETLDVMLGLLADSPSMADLPAPDSSAEAELFAALTVLFLEPARSDRARDAVRHAVGDGRFELLTALLAFIRAAHYWTETHPELELEPDLQEAFKANPELRRLVLDPTDARRVRSAAQLRQALAELADTKAVLRQKESRDAFLLKLSDAVRALGDPQAVQGAACRALLGHLAADRVFYAEVTEDGFAEVGTDCHGGGLGSVVGRHRFLDFGQAPIQSLSAGQSVVYDEVARIPELTDAERAAYTGLGIAAQVKVPLVKAGRLTAFLGVHQSTPRRWTTDEVAVIRETAERTWAAVERTRAEKARRLAEEQALAASEAARAQVIATLESIGDAFYAVDADFRLTYVNARAESIWGRPRESLIGRNMWLEFPQAVGSEPHARHLAAMRDRRPAHFETFSPVLGRWIESSIYPEPVSGGLACYFRDITERRAAEAALRDSKAHLATELEDARVLQRMSNQLVSEEGPNGHYNHIVEVARTLMRSDAASIQELDAADSRLKLLAHTGFHAESAAFWAYVDAGVGSSCGRALAARERVVVPDLDQFEADPHEIAAYRNSGIMSVQSTPLVASSGHIVGMMSTHWNRPCTPSAESYRYFDILTRLAADFMERARTRAALRESNVRFQSIANLVPDLLWSSRPDGYTDWYNHRWSEYTGQTFEQAIGWGWTAAIHPDDREGSARRYREAVDSGTTLVQEHRIRRHDGEYRWFLMRAEPVRDEAGNLTMFGSATDIHEQRTMIAAVRKSEEKYRTLFNSMDEAYAVVEVMRDDANGRWNDFLFLEVNPAFVKHTGMEYPVGKTATQLLGTPNPRWAQVYGQVAETGQPVRVEEREPTLDRVFDLYIFRLDGPGTRRVAVLFTNVTDRKRAEAALRESERRLRLSLSAARMGIWTWDVAADKQTRDGNLNALLGLPAVETVQPYEEFLRHVHPDDREAVRSAFDQTVRRGRPLDIEFRVVKPDGSIHWLRDQGDLFGEVADSRPSASTHMAGACVDVTQRREMEKERERLLKREQAARVEAERATLSKDEFLAVVSHELRTPLSAILLWTNLVLNGIVQGQAAHQALETILNSAKAQQKIIEDLLDVSRIMSGKLRLEMRNVNPNEVVQAAAEAIKPMAAAKGVEVEVSSDGRSGRITADPDRLQQVIWNLMNNAVKFTDAGGHVSVALRPLDGSIQIAVSDTGKGIDAEFLPQVFERFRQAQGSTTRTTGGLGLGLAITRQIVEAHGGTIVAESEGEGRGAKFTVTLPRSRAQSKLDSSPEVGRSNATTSADHFGSVESLSGVRVLLVEDDDANRVAVRALLTGNGAKVVDVESAERAIAAFQESLNGEPFSIIVSDIGMPVRDGYSLMREIRKIERQREIMPPVPAVALTAFVRDADKSHATAAGFTAHVGKPVEPQTLIHAILSGSRMRNTA